MARVWSHKYRHSLTYPRLFADNFSEVKTCYQEWKVYVLHQRQRRKEQYHLNDAEAMRAEHDKREKQGLG